jgi:DNA uptake protein ComE-like DNA-binding protein
MFDIVRRTVLAFIAAVPLSAAAAAFAAEMARLDPNDATAEDLTAIEGMSEELAEAILAGAPYDSTAAFDAVVSEYLDGDAKTALYEEIFVPIDLNSATEEEIALIPGMTGRMVHEFLEYRPYTDIEQFNREIGKYVDEAEVARLRSYVTL